MADELHVLIPILDDWDALERLIVAIDQELALRGWRASIQVVDDGGTPPDRLGPWQLTHIDRINVLRLRRNVGHQRAICIGLVSLYLMNVKGLVAIMDGDGQDKPEDLIRLVDACLEGGTRQIVFAGRRKRSEGLLFRMLYSLFLCLHLVLVGFKARVGSFSIVPVQFLESLVVTSETWNHYAAAVFRAGLPRKIVSTARGQRTHGHSRMNLISLVAHGLSAIAVFGDVVGTRMLLAVVTFSLCLASGGTAALVFQWASDHSVSARLIYLTGLVIVVLFHATVLGFVLVLFMLHSRSNSHFVPLRDTSYYVGQNRCVFPSNA